MKVEKKIIDENGIKYLVSGLPDANVGDIFVMQTPEEAGTDNQNRLFHKLLHEIYKSRAWSFSGLSEAEHDGLSWEHFRVLVKLEYGAGAEYYSFVDHFGHKQYSRRRPNPETYTVCFVHPISWADYSKEQRSMCIDRVMSWADAIGLGYLCEDLKKYEKAN